MIQFRVKAILCLQVFFLSFRLEAQTAEEQIAALFDQYDIVAIGEDHSNATQHNFLSSLLKVLHAQGKVQDIVVEFGNALYQSQLDAFILEGKGTLDDLKPVWRNTTQFLVWDSPVYKEFFRNVQALNTQSSHKLRVILGDPPVDWTQIKQELDFQPFGVRDDHFVEVVKTEVMEKGRKALVVAGIFHLMKWQIDDDRGQPMGETVIQRLESQYPGQSVVIHYLPQRSTWHQKFKKNFSEVQLISGKKWLEKSFYKAWNEPMMYLLNGKKGLTPVEYGPNNSPRASDLVDMFLFQPQTHKYIGPDPAILNDETYVQELLRRVKVTSPDPLFVRMMQTQLDALKN